ncbi:BadF/BadG/BcrA/BcrD ATPase family protein [Catenovulum agarivorans]|uniref:BadF/BadG/BcrA/BcrD ATPase family protein n=1 Tax=Catenovulum agarivorans TaxID=1172192 RepID=UPI00030A3F8F|nr:BadF/BadG/BcrA/BcrD ATPase family protein [Catenovulum agarivorans]
MKDNYIIAVDGGGSKCHVRLFEQTQQNAIAEYTGGSCNFASDFNQAIVNLVQSIEKLLLKADLAENVIKSCTVAGGFAGVNLPKVCQRLSNWQHPFKKFLFTTDLHLACYAANQSCNGKAIITGTGSCAIATNDSTEVILGGYGFQIGDQASGAWLGRQAIEQTLLVLDNLATHNQLSTLVTEHANTTDATQLSQLWYQASPSQFAELAPLVTGLAHENDPSALTIVNTAILYLAKLIEQLNQVQSGSTYLLGGLASFYYPMLKEQYSVKLSDHQPIAGAMVLIDNPQLSLNETYV